MQRDVDVEDATAVVGEHHEDGQQATGDRRHGEEIDGHQRPDVVLKEGPPRLGGRAAPAGQEPRDGALGQVEAKREQFTVDARCTPQGVGCGHLVNQVLEVVVHAWSPAGRSRSSRPIPREPAPMPADDCGRAAGPPGPSPSRATAGTVRPRTNDRSAAPQASAGSADTSPIVDAAPGSRGRARGTAAEQNHDSNSPHQPSDHRPA
jgi:hypothetical protein